MCHERQMLLEGLFYARHHSQLSFTMGVTTQLHANYKEYLVALPAHFWHFLQVAVDQWHSTLYQHLPDAHHNPDGADVNGKVSRQYGVLNVFKLASNDIPHGDRFSFQRHVCRDLPMTQEYLSHPALRTIFNVPEHEPMYCVIGGKTRYPNETGAATTTAFVNAATLQQYVLEDRVYLSSSAFATLDRTQKLSKVQRRLRLFMSAQAQDMPSLQS